MNVGNAGKMTPPSEDKKTLSKEVMLTTSEIQDLKELVELYPDTVFSLHRRWKTFSYLYFE